MVVALPIDCIPSQRTCRSVVSNLGAGTGGRVHWIAAGALLLLAGAAAITARPLTARPITGLRILPTVALVVAGWAALVGGNHELPPSAPAQLVFLALCAAMLGGTPATAATRRR